ncbi:MAG: D-alanyl-D-alanine carboxypeptidase/D-alanyl-D-alanine-endopeptidase [Acidimicrobiia bacterium]|nr:D-alanyl-D-alanine carboxypeptidase/D-alanyl-D-alanine-endopeptidase [Acidimicrobiia bacterium]
MTSSHWPRRLLVIALLATAAALGVWAFQPRHETSEAIGGPTLATPLWSARRTPELIREDIGARRLAYGLGLAVADVDACVLVDDERTRRVTIGDDKELIPASATKILTGSGLLAALGADHTFTTTVNATAPPDGSGAVGDLWLVGGGDPVLSTADYRAFLAEDPSRVDDPTTSLEELADAVVAAGVRHVDTLHGDDTRQDTARTVDGWDPTYPDQGVIGPLSALTVNDGYVEWGSLNVGAPDPAAYAADELAQLLEDRGVSVDATTGTDASPGDSESLAAVDSAPLGDLVGAMIRSSDNQTAEVLTRELGANAGEGTTAHGLEASAAALDDLGIDERRSLSDGSGLNRENHVACDAFIDALRSSETGAVREGLAVAGESGTLAERFRGTPLEGRLHAKTGYLNGVTALTGILDTEQGRPLTFAFLGNGGFDRAGAYQLQSDVATAIAAYPDVAPAEALVPAPLPPA